MAQPSSGAAAPTLRAVITSNRTSGSHTEYRVELMAGNAKLSSVSRRFREFQELHAQLSKFQHAFAVPDCPPKKFFGRTNPEFVVKRQNELQLFLDQLVGRIVSNPPAESAWRLLCLFLALDPKQFVPEEILRMAGQGASSVDNSRASSTSKSSASAERVGTYGIGSEGGSVSAGTGLGASGGFNASSGAAMLAVPDANADGHQDQNLNAAEIRRMERIVEEFARQAINVSCHSEERFQVPSAGQIAQISVSELTKALDEHVLSKPLCAPAKPAAQATAAAASPPSAPDGNDTAAGSENAQESAVADEGQILGAEELVISLDQLMVRSSA